MLSCGVGLYWSGKDSKCGAVVGDDGGRVMVTTGKDDDGSW